MPKTVNFIFFCMTAVMLFNSAITRTVRASDKESVKQTAESEASGKEAAGNSMSESRAEEASGQNAEGTSHAEGHNLSQIWPHYGKMVIFAKLLFAFMIFSFAAPVVHFYIKGNPHH